uniref:alpha-2-macroglobulin family protein n=1 Tax=Ornithobacterium rhinotracheale TaxID=28251 RepID=UPI0039A49A96
MKRYLFSVLFILISWTINAQNKNLMQDWKEIDSKVEQGDFKSLVPALDAIYQKALAEKDVASKIKALLLKLNIETSVSDEVTAPLEIVKLFNSEIEKSQGTERAIWQVYLAKLYSNYYVPYNSKNFTTTGERSTDFREWTQAQKIEAIKELLHEATAQPLDKPLGDFEILLTDEPEKFDLIQTLRGLLLHEAYQIMHNFSGEKNDARQYLSQLIAFQKEQNNAGWLYFQLLILKEDWENSQISKEQYLAELQEIEKHHGTNPWSTMALGEWVQESGEVSPEVYNKVEAKIKQFKDFAYTPQLEHLAYELTAPEIGVRSLDSWEPNLNSPIAISHRNLGDKIYYRLYKKDLGKKIPYDARYYFGGMEQFKGLELVKKGSVEIQKFSDLKTHQTIIPLAFPKGNYYLLFSSAPDFGSNSAIASSEIIVKNWSLKGRLLTDKKTNAPLKNAKATIITYNLEKGKIISKTPVQTNARGEIQFKIKSKKYSTSHYVEREGVFAHMSLDVEEPNTLNVEKLRGKILTDRNLYRPGQEVYVKAILYDEESMRPKVNSSYTLKFKNHRGETIATKKVKTNKFGTANASFTIPVETLSGGHSIEIAGVKKAYLRVEEYKRPNFEVKLDDFQGKASLNQSVNVTGNVVSYSGANIAKAAVEYNVRRSEFYGSYDYTQIASGKTETDAQGNFKITFDALASKAEYALYDVRVKITDPSGETHSAHKQYKFSNAPFFIVTNVKEKVLSSSFKEIDIQALNLNNQPVSENVKVEVYAYEENDRILIPFENNSDYQAQPKKDFIKQLPHIPYMGDTLKIKSLIFSKEYTTQEKSKFQLPHQLKAGHYKIVVSQKFNDTEVKSENSFVVLDDQNLKMDENTFFVSYFDADREFAPGEKAILYFGSSVKGGNVQVQIFGEGNHLIKREFVPVGAQLVRYEIPIEEAHRGNIYVNLLYEKFNYTENKSYTILVPFNNKKLEITTETFRSLLEPGKGEKWKFKVKKNDGKPAEAEVLATMYDASLDAIYKQNSLSFFPYYSANFHRIWHDNFLSFQNKKPNYNIDYKPYGEVPWLNLFGLDLDEVLYEVVVGYGKQKPLAMVGAIEQRLSGRATGVNLSALKSEVPPPSLQTPLEESTDEAPAIRKNLNETSFFYPDLKTDAQGNFWVEFAAPESLTTWNFQALAQTEDFDFGYWQSSVKTQKELMLNPNMPRFLRVGDEVSLRTRIDNLSNQPISAQVHLDLINPANNKPFDKEFKLKDKAQAVNIPAQASQVVTWKIKVPAGEPAVLYRIFAKGQKHQDGVENMLPILSNQVLVTQTMPVYVNSGQSKRFVMPNVEPNSKTRDNISMKFEITKNPTWFAVLSLPYLDNPDFKTTDNVLNAFISNAMSYQIMQDNPAFENLWKSYREQHKFESPLAQNSEYKNLALQATPWVLDAKNEKERMLKLSNYFNKNQAELNINRYLAQLESMQLNNGAFPWFKDGKENLYESVYVLQNLGEFLQDHPAFKAKTKKIVAGLVNYLDGQILKEWRETKNPFERSYLIDRVVRFLYGRSFFVKEHPFSQELSQINDYVLRESFHHMNNYTIRGKGILALTLNSYNRKAEAQKVLHFIKERATISPEMGMYWNEKFSSWFYSDIERQALLIRAFDQVSGDQESVDLMKIWLLKNKETNQWDNNKNTAAAVSALLNIGQNLMNENTEVKVQIGGKPWQPNAADEIGGVYTQTWQPSEITPNLGEIELKKETAGTAFGSLYYQYLENIDKVKGTQTGLSVKKEMYKRSNMNDHEKLIPINDKTTLNIGDIVLVRLKIQADREMEFVHLKDMRAAGLEPVKQISGYQWVSGLVYYQSTKDIATHFFIDRLGKGFHIIEYEMLVNNAGDFSNGYSEIQSFYAPGFLSRSESQRIEVED